MNQTKGSGKNQTQITLRIDPKLKKDLRELAEIEGYSLNFYLIKLLKKHLSTVGD